VGADVDRSGLAARIQTRQRNGAGVRCRVSRKHIVRIGGGADRGAGAPGDGRPGTGNPAGSGSSAEAEADSEETGPTRTVQLTDGALIDVLA